MINYFLVDVDNLTKYIQKANFQYQTYIQTGFAIQANKIKNAVNYLIGRKNQANNFILFLKRELKGKIPP